MFVDEERKKTTQSNIDQMIKTHKIHHLLTVMREDDLNKLGPFIIWEGRHVCYCEFHIFVFQCFMSAATV